MAARSDQRRGTPKKPRTRPVERRKATGRARAAAAPAISLTDRTALASAALGQMSQPAAVFDGHFRLVCCNPAASALLDLPPGLVSPGTPMRDIILHQANQGAFGLGEAEARIRGLGTTPTVRMEYRRDDGRLIMVRRDPLHDGGFVVLYNDVTEQRQAEMALQKNERRYHAIVEDHPDLIMRFTPDGRITFANTACCRFYQIGRSDFIGRDVLDFVHPDDREAVAGYFRDAGSVKQLRMIDHRAALPGEYVTRWLHRTDRPIYDAHGALTEYQAVLHDVTELRLAHEQAQRINKLTTLGRLVAGITHELNQPLSAASLAAQNALFDLESVAPLDTVYVQEKLRTVTDRLAHMGNIVNHLRTFARPSADAAASADAIEVVRRSVDLVENELRLDNIRFDLALPPSCRRVRASPLDLETILANLFTNARDAIVRARKAHDAPAAGHVHVTVSDLDALAAIQFVVRDDGGGIPGELLACLFDPFVTTKEAGGGMGLGLSIVHQTVANLGGTIDVCNVMGGAEFRIKIPVAPEG